MKRSFQVSALLLGASGALAVKFPSDSRFVEMGGVTDQMQVKFQSGPGSDHKLFVERVLSETGCAKASRIFRHAGKHEEKMVEAGLNRWYTFDCASAAPADHAEGQGAQAAVSKLQQAFVAQSSLNSDGVMAPSEETSDRFGIDIVSFEHKIEEHGLPSDTKQGIRGSTRRSLAVSNDPLLNLQDHYSVVNMQGAWDIMENNNAWANAENVVCQVLDSGWDMSHVDLGANAWDNPGETCGTNQDNDGNGFVDDCHGYNHADNTGNDLLGAGDHGTHVAGTIGANTDNGIGVAGVAGGTSTEKGVSIMTSVGFGTSGNSGFAEAITYAANNGAHISSNSWGYIIPGAFDQSVLDAIDYAVNQGVIVVFAAGNNGQDNQWYPGFYDKTIAVAALEDNKVAAGFSNFGTWVDIAAPGVNVYSTELANSYGYKSGTSMACPHVSAILGLGKSLHPSATPTQLKNCLFDTAENIDSLQSPTRVGKLGAGLVDAEAFLLCVENLIGGGPAPTPPTPGPPGPATLMPVCPYSRTFSATALSRGFYFTAPTDFCIVGLSVPNEQNEALQNVQVFIRDTIPELWPGSSRGGSVFYAPNMNAGSIISTDIQVTTGDVVGLLGTAGSGTMQNSYCDETSYTTSIGGRSVTIARLLTQQSISTGASNEYSREIASISRVNMYYQTGSCGAPPVPSPTPAPVSGPIETLMPICPYSRTFSSSSATRGFYFTAPTNFCITGLSVPNEQGEALQNVQVFIRDSIPALYPAVSTGGSVFYAANMNAGEIISTEIEIVAGDVVGLLGAPGTATMRNSYCAENSFDTTIAGRSVTIERFLTQQSIASSPANDYSREIGNISRVNMYYKAGSCDGRSTPTPVSPMPVTPMPATPRPVAPAPTSMPSSSPSSSPSAENCEEDGFCGNCNEESTGMGCNCPRCEVAVCALDSYCCDVRWDDTCASAAETVCKCPLEEASNSPSSSPSAESCLEDGVCGNCNVEGATTGCNCPKCEEQVCAVDSYCCDVRWDSTCAAMAESICGCETCPTGTCGNCDEFRGAPGCSCPECEMKVCEMDGHCCEFFWDRQCVLEAKEFCDCPKPTPDPTPMPSSMPSSHPTLHPTPEPTECVGDCVSATGGSGCGFCHLPSRSAGCSSCPKCEETVCSLESSCCSQWNDKCAELAIEHCNCCLGP